MGGVRRGGDEMAETMGPIETTVHRLIEDSMTDVPLSDGRVWGDLVIAGGGTLPAGNVTRELLALGRAKGVEDAVLFLARHLDGN